MGERTQGKVRSILVLESQRWQQVSASRDAIENAFLRILGMLVATREFLNDLPRIAKSHWARSLERIRNERRRISTIFEDVKTLNQKIVMQKVSGELSAEDFAMVQRNRHEAED